MVRKILFLLLVSLCVFTHSTLAQPDSYLDKVFSTPDLTQTDPQANFAQNGANYCAPVAVSNSFVWLSEHGYQKLLPHLSLSDYAKEGNKLDTAKERILRQIKLVEILSSREYMGTIAGEGTYIDEVLLGIKKYILRQGYSIKQLSYLGFRSSQPEFDIGLRRPKLSLLKEVLPGKSAIWLNIGWYQYKPESNTYVRMGGHWVTLVGYGMDKDNKPARNVFIIHNPSPRAGTAFHNDYISFEPIGGVLVSRKGLLGFPRPASGYYKIVGDLKPVDGSNTVLLESSIMLELY